MNYLKKYNTFNEGLFGRNETDDEIVLNIIDILNKSQFNIIKNNSEYVVKNIKLDKNPGKYNLYSFNDMLKIEYYKHGVLVFVLELKCTDKLKSEIYLLLDKKYNNNDHN